MAPPTKGRSVLLVDDEMPFATAIAVMLERVGYAVTCATTGFQTLTQLKGGKFDVVVTDMLMPELDGTAVIALCKKHQPQAKIVAMSGGGRFLGSTDVLVLATKLGANGWLEKPFPIERLLALIEASNRSTGGQ